MSNNSGFLYALQVNVTEGATTVDYYQLAVGVGTVKVTETEFLISRKPFYFQGVNRHEDWDIHGKGFDYPLAIKDVYAMKWMGVNAFHTSHYPYAKELLKLCDQEGIVVICESPAMCLREQNYLNKTLEHHLEVMTELVQRDKNRPSVVTWSLANEPDSSSKNAQPYFEAVAKKTRELDSIRPIMFACDHDFSSDLVTQFMDAVMINRYYG